MSVQGVTGGTITGIGDGPIDSTDLAFRVMQLQIETLDGEINGRLGQMDQINALRKAYNERMSALRECLQDLKYGRAEVPADLLAAGHLEWDPAANDGRGGAAMVSDGTPARFGDATFRVQQSDGTFLELGEMDSGTGATAHATTSRELVAHIAERGFPHSCREGDSGEETGSSAEAPSHVPPSWDYQTRSLEEAQAMAEQYGGTVVASVTREQVQGRIDALQDLSENLGADAEIGMLSLNRLLSRRNQALQLASNVMASDNQTAMGIIANMKV